MKKNENLIHYKKIQIKHIKKENSDKEIDVNNNDIKQKNEINIPNKIKINKKLKLNDIEENNNNNMFNLDDINNQLDEILESIDVDGIDEINKKIKFLGEDKKMLNAIPVKNNLNFKKINTNKMKYKRNKIYMNTETINNNHKKKGLNLSNNRYLFSSANNNSYRYWKDENNCNDNDEDEDEMNRTNISLFYKYNNFTKNNNNNDDYYYK